MGLFSKKETAPAAAFPKDSAASSDPNTPASRSVVSLDNQQQNAPAPSTEDEPNLTLIAFLLGAIASMGGFIFGYESGQISGTHLSFVLAALADTDSQ